MTSSEIKKLAACLRDGDGAGARSVFRKIFMIHAQETGLDHWLYGHDGLVKNEYFISQLSGHWVEHILGLSSAKYKGYSEFFIDFGVHISKDNEIAIYSQVANEDGVIETISDIYESMMVMASHLENKKWRDIDEPFEATQI